MRKILTKQSASSRVDGIKEEVVGFFCAKAKDSTGMLSAYSTYRNSAKGNFVNYLMEINPESENLEIKISRQLIHPFKDVGIMINVPFEVNRDMKATALNTIIKGQDFDDTLAKVEERSE